MVMKLGTIVFYQRYDDFLTILKNANVKEVSLALDDEIFHKFCGQAKQPILQRLYRSSHSWGFLCGKVNKMDGTVAYKVLNYNNKVNEIKASDVYFALEMDDFTFTHWAEMESEKKIKTSPQGTAIMKKPSNSSIKQSNTVKRMFGMGFKMLYQIVSLREGRPNYPDSNPYNDQWRTYEPFQPTTNPFDHYMKASPYDYSYPHKYHGGQTTFHAVPFFRDNIQPTTFSVVKEMSKTGSELKMFINFPTGIPLSFA